MTELSRRGFLAGFVATAGGLLVPEPVRAYSFVGGWATPADDLIWLDYGDITARIQTRLASHLSAGLLKYVPPGIYPPGLLEKIAKELGA